MTGILSRPQCKNSSWTVEDTNIYLLYMCIFLFGLPLNRFAEIVEIMVCRGDKCINKMLHVWDVRVEEKVRCLVNFNSLSFFIIKIGLLFNFTVV